jgi:Flp pilus assembly protein TadG
MILMLVLLTIVIGMVAMSVDAGLMVLLRAEIQNAVDAGAVAAALRLQGDPENIDEAESMARNYVQRNRVGFTALVPEDAIDVEQGYFDGDTNTFTPTSVSPNAVRIYARQDAQPFFFARIFGYETFGAPAEAIASADPRPLDVMMVLDLSGSMADEGRIEALQNAAPTFVDVIEELGARTISVSWAYRRIPTSTTHPAWDTMGRCTIQDSIPPPTTMSACWSRGWTIGSRD